jgi:hypothetical protein
MAVALECSRCGATSVSSLFYQGPDGHICRVCGGVFSLLDPARDRRRRPDRRGSGDDMRWAEWRSGSERRRTDALVFQRSA